MDVSLVTAFLGGVLALLSPCGALLLPAFFAATAGSGPRLVLHAGVFFAGLTVTLVPLGLGVGALGSLATSHRDTMVLVTAVLLVVLGLLQTLGFGFDLSRVLPGGQRLSNEASARSGLVRTLLLGAASGVAGFCAGPILGAVLTLAAASGETGYAGLLLAIYGAGMVLPLLLLAALWGRMSDRTLRVLRGRGFVVLGRRLHTTSMTSGILVMGVGVLFWTTNGLVTMPSLAPVGVQSDLQARIGVLAHPLVDIAAIAVLAIAVLVVWATVRSRRELKHRELPGHSEEATKEETKEDAA